MKRKEFLSFEDAREFVSTLNIPVQTKWVKYCKSGNKPNNIPANPQLVYKNCGWVTWGDWLGTGRIATSKQIYLPFNEAKSFVHTLKLNCTREWKIYGSSGNKPNNIPSNPQYHYKEWISFYDWLGYKTQRKRYKNFLPFEDARAFVHTLNLKSEEDWKKYSKSGNKPSNIPSAPKHRYKNNGWIRWGDWIGTGRIADKNREFLSYEEAKKIIHPLKLNGSDGWQLYCKSGNRPDNIPSNPNSHYKEWVDYVDWLGTETIRKKRGNFLPFKEARDFVRSLHFKSQIEWSHYASRERPKFIPSTPSVIYKDEWIDWGDWLGTGSIATQQRQFLSFEEAKKYLRPLNIKSTNEWKKYCKSGNKPNNIPSVPKKVYGDMFIGFGDFLGNGNIAQKYHVYRPFNEARDFIRSLNFKTMDEWKAYCKSGNKPDDIPAKPDQTYRRKK